MLDLYAIRFVEGTKISHDYQDKDVNLFSYRDLINRGVPCIGIPCKQNKLLVIDIDVKGESHSKDGREWWANFSENEGIPPTYTVSTRSGGYHFYFKLPESVNPDTFSPPASLADGVDIKWAGWVAAPPTAGYAPIIGDVSKIQVAPPSLMAEISSKIQRGGTREFTFDPMAPATLALHKPFTSDQLRDLEGKILWIQQNVALTREEWRNGLFAFKAGIEDAETLEYFATKWTQNRAYMPGDEKQAMAICERADRFGSIGPGSIFGIIGSIMARSQASQAITKYSFQEIMDKAGCIMRTRKDGKMGTDVSESNAAAILAAMFDKEDLYFDVRQDFYIFNGKAIGDQDLLNTLVPYIQSDRVGLGLDKFKKSIIESGIEILMNLRRVDPHALWLSELKWDGIPRIDMFWSTYAGIEATPYTTALGKNFWLSLAGRGLNPGCKYDSMIILEGAEGIMKSSLVQAIGGEYTFAPATNNLMSDTDELRKMHQSVLVELPELMGLIDQDPNKVKAFMSKSFDHIRPLYAKKAIKSLRGFIFIGTTNNNRYLSADMGIRRFLPLKMPKGSQVNIGGIQTDREQLFAEAVHRYKQGETFYEVPKEALAKQVNRKVVSEPLLSPIEEIVRDLVDIKPLIVYQRLESLGYIPRGLSHNVNKRIETSLKILGYEESHDGTCWVKPEVRLDSFI